MRIAVAKPEVFKACAIGLGYFAFASLTIAWTRFDGGVAQIWVAAALLTAQLVRTDFRHWREPLIACSIASFMATGLFGLGWIAAGPLVAVNIGESVIAAALLRHLGMRQDYLNSLGNVGLFAICAGAVAPAITGIGGAVTAALVTGLPIGQLWTSWFAGHALGMMVFAPMMTLMLQGEVFAWARKLTPRGRAEAAVLIGIMAFTSFLVFSQERLPLLFLPMLPLTIITFRLDRVGAALSIIMLVMISGMYTAAGHGPVNLIQGTSSIHSLFLQLYLAVTVMTVLPVAAELKQRKDIYRRLRESEMRYKLITESATDIVLELNTRGVIRYVSPSVREITGFSPDALIGKRPHALMSGPDARTFIAAHRQVRQSPGATTIIEYRGMDAAGELKWFEANNRGIFDDEGVLIGSVSAIRDISHRKSLEMRLAHAASTDSLTGLGNRRAFDALLDRILENRRSGEKGGCVAIFDLDFFKHINDLHGHAIGDRVLQTFATTALRIVRSHDYVGRLGGEEFGIILEGVDIEQATRICDRLRSAVAQEITRTPTGVAVTVTASAGIAAIHASQSRQQIMMAADQALYAAKAAGRDRLATAA